MVANCGYWGLETDAVTFQLMLNFPFYFLNLSQNSHMWLVAILCDYTIVDNPVNFVCFSVTNLLMIASLFELQYIN